MENKIKLRHEKEQRTKEGRKEAGSLQEVYVGRSEFEEMVVDECVRQRLVVPRDKYMLFTSVPPSGVVSCYRRETSWRVEIGIGGVGVGVGAGVGVGSVGGIVMS